MDRETISGRQWWMWLVTAMTAPILQVAGKYSLLMTAIAAIACACLMWSAFRFATLPKSKSVVLLEILWLTVILGLLTVYADQVWPTGRDYPTVSVALLLLAALSAAGEPNNAAQVNGIVFWFVALLLSVLLVAGVPRVEIRNAGLQWDGGDYGGIWLLLLPAISFFLPVNRKKTNGVFLALAAFTIACGVWTEGILTMLLSRQAEWPVYEVSKSIRISAVADRLEPLVSVGATMGYYSLYSLILTAVGVLFEQNWPKYKKWAIMTSAAAAALFGSMSGRISPYLIALISIIMWLFVPLFSGFRKRKNKFENQ